MRSPALFASLVALSFAIPCLTGCEDTISKEEEIKVKEDGTVTKETEKTVRESDGTIKKTEEKTVDRPE